MAKYIHICDDNTYIVCNDINLSRQYMGGREFFDILDDKIGGKPYLPEGISYPKDSSGENMALLLQINLSKYILDGFPQKGFFEIFVQPNLTSNCEYKIINCFFLATKYKFNLLCKLSSILLVEKKCDQTSINP